MKIITERQELVELAKELGVRPNWHEPDEQDLTALVDGHSFDDAGFWPNGEGRVATELHVLLYKTEYNEVSGYNERSGEPIAAVNLTTLFAWATGYEESPKPDICKAGYENCDYCS